MLLDQFIEYVAQRQSQYSSKEMDHRVCDNPDLDSTALQDSSSSLCCDVLVVNDSNPEDNIVADIVDNAGVVDDDGEPIKPDYAFIDDGTVEICAMEAKFQKSLPLVVYSPKLELEPLPDQEKATFTFSKSLGFRSSYIN